MIKCVVKDSGGNELGSFALKGEKNIVDEAADSGIELPFSCHAGACMTCAGRVTAGVEFLDNEKDGPKYMDTDEGVELMCITGAKPEFVSDADEHIVEVTMMS